MWLGCADVAFAQGAGVGPAPLTTSGEVAAATTATTEGPVVTTSTRAPAVEVVTAKKVRHDWYLGFAFGLGGGNLRAKGTGTGPGVALTGLLRAGGRLTDKIALGGLGVTSFGGDKTALVGFSNMLAEGLFFPIKGRGLGLSLGLGLSSAWVRVPGNDGMLIDKQTKFGGAFGLGVGHDFWLARRFNLGLWLRADGSAGGFGVRASGTLGLAFSWF